MSYELERRVAVEAVLAASRLCRSVQANLVTADSLAKKDRSPVTVADFGAQAVVATMLGRVLDDPIVGEESAEALRTDDGADLRERVVHHVHTELPELDGDAILDAIDRCNHGGGPGGRHWALDPIDGTKGFLRGDQYAVALGLIEDGEVVLGVLGCPNLPLDLSDPDGPRGCLFVAVAGEGAFTRGVDDDTEHPIHVSSLTSTREASFVESVESGHSSHGHSAQIAELLGVEAPPVRIDSQCKYAAVARGDAAIYLRLPTRKDYEEKIWDHAAGWCVVTEAGGRVTDVRGRDLDFSIGRTLRDNKGVVATNGAVHDRVITAVRQVLSV
jgi:3'(2'), 5'-bisphosphate nucleotidase